MSDHNTYRGPSSIQGQAQVKGANVSEDFQRAAEGQLLAAIDLGSNSFHMLVVRVEHGEARPVERLAETVQLAVGMNNGLLGEASMGRALDCLARFRQALDILQPDMVRIIGTNSLRAAKNGKDFRRRAEAVVGQPIEVISGREEARLIYLGVAHTLADDGSRLVVDIGGGSTEFMIGERFEARLLESLHMGCVSYGERFFPDGVITKKAFESAYLAAYSEVLNIRSACQQLGWTEAVGSSGTLRSLESVIAAQGWVSAELSADNLKNLQSLIFKYPSIKALCKLAGLSERRRNVFASGLAIARALFDALEIDQMRTSSGALREGVVYDTIGRLKHEDVRERSVNALIQRYGVDEDNGRKVEETARYLFAAVADQWQFTARDWELLAWACRLHELGLAIAHSGFHKHGQYLLENSDLPGFDKTEQIELGLLVRGHRQKFPVDEFRAQANGRGERLEHLCLVLRLAVLFKYVAPVEGAPACQWVARGNNLSLHYPRGWLKGHPLTRFALQREQALLVKAGIQLSLDRQA